MFGNDTGAEGAVSRRSVLRSAGAVLAGSTALVDPGTERAAALPESRGTNQVAVLDLTGTYLAVEVRFPERTVPAEYYDTAVLTREDR